MIIFYDSDFDSDEEIIAIFYKWSAYYVHVPLYPLFFRDYFGEKIGIYFAWLGKSICCQMEKHVHLTLYFMAEDFWR